MNSKKTKLVLSLAAAGVIAAGSAYASNNFGSGGVWQQHIGTGSNTSSQTPAERAKKQIDRGTNASIASTSQAKKVQASNSYAENADPASIAAGLGVKGVGTANSMYTDRSAMQKNANATGINASANSLSNVSNGGGNVAGSGSTVYKNSNLKLSTPNTINSHSTVWSAGPVMYRVTNSNLNSSSFKLTDVALQVCYAALDGGSCSCTVPTTGTSASSNFCDSFKAQDAAGKIWESTGVLTNGSKLTTSNSKYTVETSLSCTEDGTLDKKLCSISAKVSNSFGVSDIAGAGANQGTGANLSAGNNINSNVNARMRSPDATALSNSDNVNFLKKCADGVEDGINSPSGQINTCGTVAGNSSQSIKTNDGPSAQTCTQVKIPADPSLIVNKTVTENCEVTAPTATRVCFLEKIRDTCKTTLNTRLYVKVTQNGIYKSGAPIGSIGYISMPRESFQANLNSGTIVGCSGVTDLTNFPRTVIDGGKDSEDYVYPLVTGNISNYSVPVGIPSSLASSKTNALATKPGETDNTTAPSPEEAFICYMTSGFYHEYPVFNDKSVIISGDLCNPFNQLGWILESSQTNGSTCNSNTDASCDYVKKTYYKYKVSACEGMPDGNPGLSPVSDGVLAAGYTCAIRDGLALQSQGSIEAGYLPRLTGAEAYGVNMAGLPSTTGEITASSNLCTQFKKARNPSLTDAQAAYLCGTIDYNQEAGIFVVNGENPMVADQCVAKVPSLVQGSCNVDTLKSQGYTCSASSTYAGGASGTSVLSFEGANLVTGGILPHTCTIAQSPPDVYKTVCSTKTTDVSLTPSVVNDLKTVKTPANTLAGFAQAAAGSGVISGMEKGLSSNDSTQAQGLPAPKLFGGEAMSCDTPATLSSLQNNCCDRSMTRVKNKSISLNGKCTEADVKLAAARRAKRTYELGQVCKNKMFEICTKFLKISGPCREKIQGACVFDSLLSRVISEQGRIQLAQLATGGSYTTSVQESITKFSMFTDKPSAVTSAINGKASIEKSKALADVFNKISNGSISLTQAEKEGQFISGINTFGASQSGTAVAYYRWPWYCEFDETKALGSKEGFNSCSSGVNVGIAVCTGNPSPNSSSDPSGRITYCPPLKKDFYDQSSEMTNKEFQGFSANWRTFESPFSEKAQLTALTDDVFISGSCELTGSCTFGTKVLPAGEGSYSFANREISWPLAQNNAFIGDFTIDASGTVSMAPATEAQTEVSLNLSNSTSSVGNFFIQPFAYSSLPQKLPETIRIKFSTNSGQSYQFADLPTSLNKELALSKDTPNNWSDQRISSNPVLSVLKGGCSIAENMCKYTIRALVEVTPHPWPYMVEKQKCGADGHIAAGERCGGFTAAQLTSLDFGKMDLSEWTNEILKDVAATDESAKASAISSQMNGELAAYSSLYSSNGTASSSTNKLASAEESHEHSEGHDHDHEEESALAVEKAIEQSQLKKATSTNFDSSKASVSIGSNSLAEYVVLEGYDLKRACEVYDISHWGSNMNWCGHRGNGALSACQVHCGNGGYESVAFNPNSYDNSKDSLCSYTKVPRYKTYSDVKSASPVGSREHTGVKLDDPIAPNTPKALRLSSKLMWLNTGAVKDVTATVTGNFPSYQVNEKGQYELDSNGFAVESDPVIGLQIDWGDCSTSGGDNRLMTDAEANIRQVSSDPTMLISRVVSGTEVGINASNIKNSSGARTVKTRVISGTHRYQSAMSFVENGALKPQYAQSSSCVNPPQIRYSKNGVMYLVHPVEARIVTKKSDLLYGQGKRNKNYFNVKFDLFNLPEDFPEPVSTLAGRSGEILDSDSGFTNSSTQEKTSTINNATSNSSASKADSRVYNQLMRK